MAKPPSNRPPSPSLDDEDDIGDPIKPVSATAETEVIPAQSGRPTLAETAARPAPGKIEAVKMEHPHRIGIKCPSCGRVVDPRILRTDGNQRKVQCTSCGRSCMVTYSADGWPREYRFVR